MREGPLRVALTALGCKVNAAEMDDLAGRLAAAGCDVVPDDESADVRVLNSCTVTHQADATTRQRLRRLRRADPSAHIVLTGCSVDGNPAVYLRRGGGGSHLLPESVDAVFANARKEAIADHVTALAARRAPTAAAGATPRRTRALVKVQDGCGHRCTYCSVWRARGPSRSVAVDAVRGRVADAIAAGHREVVLTGVDLGSFGRDAGTTLARLVGTLLDDVGHSARIRLSSVNTNDVTAELIELNGHPRLCAHWHMPLQSGSDSVLRAMHRGYRRAQYVRVCAELRHADPDTEFTTDVMVAFPGETDTDHRQTLELLDECDMLAVHAFRYSARDGTPAASLEGRADDAVARRRSAEVRRAATLSGRRRLERAVGRVHDVIWERVEDGTARGLSATYIEVAAVATPRTAPGAASSVRGTAVEGASLRGTVLGA